jgi:hypothetical protein
MPRWAAACIAIGPIVHIAGGDLSWTVITGSSMLAIGLAVLAHTALGSISRQADEHTDHRLCSITLNSSFRLMPLGHGRDLTTLLSAPARQSCISCRARILGQPRA